MGKRGATATVDSHLYTQTTLYTNPRSSLVLFKKRLLVEIVDKLSKKQKNLHFILSIRIYSYQRILYLLLPPVS